MHHTTSSPASAVPVAFLLEVRTPYRDQLLSRLVDDGELDLSVLYCTDSEPWRLWELGGAPYRSTTLKGVAGGGRAGGFNAKLNPSVWRALSAARPRAVILGGYALPTNQLAMLWCRRHRVPYLLLWESHDLDPRGVLRRAVAWAPSTIALQGAAAMLPASSRARDRLLRSGFPSARLYVLPNAPDVRSIARAVKRPHISDRHPPTFLFSGRLVASKDVSSLLQAFARVQKEIADARLVITGSGPLELDLKTMVSALGIGHVSFKGFLQADDLLKEYAAADVFVLPSREEPFGVVVMEAMAAGMPVVVSDRVGCASDLVDPSCGAVFPAGDVEQLAAAMLALASDPVRCSEMGDAARAAVMRWDIEYCARTVHQAVKDALRPADSTMSEA